MSGLHVFNFEDKGELRARWAEGDGTGKVGQELLGVGGDVC